MELWDSKEPIDIMVPWTFSMDWKLYLTNTRIKKGRADCKWVPGLMNGGLGGPMTFNYVWGLKASNEVSS